MPKITVLMPVYNGEKYLRESVDSILNQTFTNFELLIINDGSTDSSMEILNSYNDARIRIVTNEENLRLIKTLNKGIDLATGEYIARMDCDDIADPKRLEIQLQYMEKHPDVAVCGTGVKVIDQNRKPWQISGSPDLIRNCLYVRSCMIHPSVMMRTEFLKENNIYYDLNYLHAEDYELFQRLSEKYKVVNLEEPLLNYRWSETSVSSLNASDQEVMAAKISTEALSRIGIEFDRVPYARNTLTKEELLEVKRQLEEQYCKANREDQNIKQVFQFLWLDMILKGTHHGLWNIKILFSPKFCSVSLMDKGLLTRIIAKSLLKK
ncbi:MULTISPECIES: glycosyltransferase family 2 protein [Bacillus]|uniref:Glycosyl transferase family A n=2 Tax=Bacillus cereus group TaxID=86661 RepID=A0A1S9TRY7_BACCE|nr:MULTISPECIES: glycosyltransferase family A protein [Bacillus]ABY46368.1 glycosyl transferase family 2 [Bacillus mycoides KBAB4]KZD32763.1 Glycosyl transferase group 2 family protein [Bacillus cereus]MBK5469855.1 glycosyltransferase family 2 protein [Bacillus sp. TH19]OOR12804.1 glycosyl transferase family A [Bacillus cereus]PEK94348.1 glycosyltransferase family 2 protein [Bacillus mycoides]